MITGLVLALLENTCLWKDSQPQCKNCGHSASTTSVLEKQIYSGGFGVTVIMKCYSCHSTVQTYWGAG